MTFAVSESTGAMIAKELGKFTPMGMYSQYERAAELTEQKRHLEALVLYNQALKQNPLNPDIHHDRGVCLLHLKKNNEAIAEMDIAIQLDPHYGYRYASRAFIKSSVRDYSGAISDYEKAIELDPEDAISENNLGLIMEQMGFAKEAKRRFDAADELSEMLKDNNISQSREQPTTIALDRPRTNPSSKTGFSREIGKAITTRKGLSEFFSFVKNGFRLD
jgi:tetratricopeptide (TPR) repeat protein